MKNVILVTIVALAGCTWTNLSYSPNSLSDHDQAVRNIEQLLWEQSDAELAPKSVAVTRDYFRVSQDSVENSRFGLRVTASTTVENATTVYFNNIAKATLHHKGMYQVMLRDASGEVIYRYYQRDGEKAKRFIDSLQTLR